MKNISRQEVIDRLVADEIDTIEQMVYQNDYTYIESIVREGGIAGFNNLCNEDLEDEYYSKFKEYINIKN